MDSHIVEYKPGSEEAQASLRRVWPTDVPWEQGGRVLALEAVRTETKECADRLVKIGRWLAYAKSQVKHGEYKAFLNEAGLSKRFAWECVSLALRMPELAGHLAPSKAIALLGLSDEQIAALEAGEEVGGLKADAINLRTVRELDAVVKRLNANLEKGKEQFVKERERRLAAEEAVEDLRDTNARLQREAERSAKFTASVAAALRAVTSIERAITDEQQISPEHAHTMFTQLQSALSALRERHPHLFHGLTAADEGQD